MSSARVLLSAVFLAAALPAGAQPSGPAAVTGYAELAGLALGAPVVARGRVAKLVDVADRLAPGLRPGWRRYLVTMDVAAALRAPDALPARVEFLWDGPRKRPDLKRGEVLAFLSPGGRPDQFRLVGPRALVAHGAAAEATVRGVLVEARDPALARRRVTGVARAFTVPGTVPGEAETQLFLDTAGGEPVSLVVVSRPGEPKRWSAAFGDTIDEAAGPVRAGTLAWYYLACGLPAALPEAAVADLDAAGRAAAAEDYAFVRRSLGPCGRSPANEASSTPTPAQSG